MKSVILSLLTALIIIMVGNTVYSQQSTTYIVSSNQSVNARACPRLDCAITTTFASGAEVQVLNTTHGATVSGSTIWYRVEYNGEGVFVHSSLLRPLETTSTTSSSAVPVNQEDWVQYLHLGFGISLPSGWENYTGNPDYLDLLVASAKVMTPMDEEQEGLMRASYVDALIVVDPITQASVLVQADYSGLDIDPTTLERFCDDSVPDMTGSCEMTELPSGDALHGHFYNDAYDVNLFFVSRNRTQYIITVSVLSTTEDMLSIYQAIGDSFVIQTTQAVRTHSVLRAGTARRGENHGTLEVGNYAAWIYWGVPDEILAIDVCESESENTPFDLYLIVRGPDGEVVAENDNSGFFNSDSNPRIDNLELVERGIYTIEVHGVRGFTAGSYILCLEDGNQENEA